MSSDIPEEVVEVEEAVVVEEEAVEEEEEAVVEEVAPDVPPPKRRGRPAGRKNKTKVVPLELPPEPEPQPVITREPTKRPRKTNTHIPEPPLVDPSVLILNALREHQQQRAARKAAKYSAWLA